MILQFWLAHAFFIVLFSATSTVDRAERAGRQPELARIPWDIWLGLGLLLVGLLWGESIRMDAPPRSETALAAFVIHIALVNVVFGGVRREWPASRRGMRVAPLTWLALGLFGMTFIVGDSPATSEAAHIAAWWLAVVLVLIPAALGCDHWLATRRRHVSTDGPSGSEAGSALG